LNLVRNKTCSTGRVLNHVRKNLQYWASFEPC